MSNMNIYTPMIYWYDDKAAITALDVQPVPVPSTKQRDFERNCDYYYKLVTVSVQTDVRIWEYFFEKNPNPSGADKLDVYFIANLPGHTKTVNCCKFSPNGEMLATGDVDGTLLVWMYVDEPIPNDPASESMDLPPNKENWKKKFRVRFENDINCLCWSPDSKFIASGSADNSVAVHDGETGRRMWELRNFRNVPLGLTWDPHNKYLVCCSSDRRLDIIDARRGHRLRTLFSVTGLNVDFGTVHTQPEVPYKLFHDSQLITFTRSVDFSPCGKLLFVPSAHLEVGDSNIYGTYVIRRADFDTCRPFAFLPSTKPTIAVKCSPVIYELFDKEENFLGLPYRVIFATLDKNSIMVYDSQHASPIMFIDNIHYDNLSSVCWAPDGKNIVVSSFEGFNTFIKDFEPKLGKRATIPELTDEEINVLKKPKKVPDESKKTKKVTEEKTPKATKKLPVDGKTSNKKAKKAKEQEEKSEKEVLPSAPSTPKSVAPKKKETPSSSSANSILKFLTTTPKAEPEKKKRIETVLID